MTKYWFLGAGRVVYLDLHLEFVEDGNLYTWLCDKCDDFDFPVVTFPYLSSNIPEYSTYGVFVSHFIRYARVCSKYEVFLFICMIYSGFKVIEAGIFFMETSDYFSEILWSSYWFTNLTLLCHICSSCFASIVTGATCGAGNVHSFRNTCFHSLWGVHDFTRSLYIHYRICQS